MNVFFTSDTHFGHDALVHKGLRIIPGVETIDQHDALLAARWNSLVGKNDTVYHLGDFAWREPAKYRGMLNGQIHLVLGNHDRIRAADKGLFESISDIKRVRVGERRIYMCHYAMRVWNTSHYGAWHLYGHSHGSLPDDPNSRSLDVGVDCWNYYPVTVAQLEEKMAAKSWRPVDHHTALRERYEG